MPKLIRVLYVTPEMPRFPGGHGGNTREFCLLRGLAGHYEIDVVSLSGFSADEARNLEDLGVRVLLGRATLQENGSVARPAHQTIDQVKRYGAFALSLATASVKRGYPPLWRSNVVAFEGLPWGSVDFEDYDLVNIEHTYLLPAARYIKERAPLVPLTITAHNIETIMTRRVAELVSPVLDRLRLQVAARRVAQVESRLLSVVDRVVTVSEGDAAWIQNAVDDPPQVSVVENGVDLDYFTPNNEPAVTHTAVFTGALGHPPNSQGVVWLADRVWPKVRNALPDARITIVGWSRFAPAAVLELDAPGIELALDAPDIRPYLRKAEVAVVPVHAGSGSRLKILEAMAAGVPVVSTTIGAEGLNPPESAIRVSDEPFQFADHVARLMSNEGERRFQAELARQWVAERHGWGALSSRLAEVWHSTASEEAPSE